MNLLAGVLYDPATAVSKATTSALALTALDTVNLRLTVKAPPSGKLFVRMAGVLHGATTYPQIVLGVLRGTTVMARQAPMTGGGNLAATTMQNVESRFLITGLTPGQQYVLDAAYGVETVVASTGLKYGGPNNTTANDNFGGFVYEIYDPCPIYTPGEPGSPSEPAAPTTTLHDKIDTIDDFLDTEVAAILAAVDTEVGAIKTQTDKLTFTVANKLDVNVLVVNGVTVTGAGTAGNPWGPAA